MARYTPRAKKSYKRTARKATYRRKASASSKVYRSKTSRYKRSQQSDIKNTMLKTNVIGNLSINNQVVSGVTNYAGTACYSTLAHLLKNTEFLEDVSRYDQFKINFVNVKITPYNAVTVTAEGSNQMFSTAWDRNGIEDASSVPSYSELVSYSSVKSQNYMSFARMPTVYRSVKADGVIEKGTYFNTKDFTTDRIKELFINGAKLFHCDPTNQKEFNPLLIVGMHVATAASYGKTESIAAAISAPQSFAYNMEWTFGISFKGKRSDNGAYGPTISSAYQWLNVNAAPSYIPRNEAAVQNEASLRSIIPAVRAPQTEEQQTQSRIDIILAAQRILHVYGFKKYNLLSTGDYQVVPYLATTTGYQFITGSTALTMNAENAVAFVVIPRDGYLEAKCIVYDGAGASDTFYTPPSNAFSFVFNISLPNKGDGLSLVFSEKANAAAAAVSPIVELRFVFNSDLFVRSTGIVNSATVLRKWQYSTQTLLDVKTVAGFVQF